MVAETTVEYLSRFPREAAALLESAGSEDRHALFAELEVELQAGLLSHVLPATAAAYLAACERDNAVELVGLMHIDDAAQALAHLRLRERSRILERLSSARRERVAQMLRFPDDSAGATMITPAPACREDATVRAAKRIVRRMADREVAAVAVLDALMHPVGLVTTTTLMTARERSLVREHMRPVSIVIRVNDAMANVVSLKQWRSDDYGLVVHSDGQFAGMLLKAQLFEHSLSSRTETPGAPTLATSIVTVADMMWSVGAGILVRGTGAERPDREGVS